MSPTSSHYWSTLCKITGKPTSIRWALPSPGPHHIRKIISIIIVPTSGIIYKSFLPASTSLSNDTWTHSITPLSNCLKTIIGSIVIIMPRCKSYASCITVTAFRNNYCGTKNVRKVKSFENNHIYKHPIAPNERKRVTVVNVLLSGGLGVEWELAHPMTNQHHM